MFKIYSITCFLCLTLSFTAFSEDGKSRDGKVQTTQAKKVACTEDNQQPDYQYEVSGMTVSYESSKSSVDSLDLEWELGDNTTIQSIQKFNHTYQNLGNYETCLTLNSSTEAEKPTKKCKVITLGDPKMCEADWVPVCGCDNQTYMNSCFAENYHGVYYWEEGPCSNIDYSLYSSFIYENQPNLAIQFINTSAGNFDSYRWDFGNGQNSNARNPQILFPIKGAYTICLTVHSSVTKMQETYCEEIEVGMGN
ncbi:MAG: PKD domain-containing protein [Chitinophagales bacterium]